MRRVGPTGAEILFGFMKHSYVGLGERCEVGEGEAEVRWRFCDPADRAMGTGR